MKLMVGELASVVVKEDISLRNSDIAELIRSAVTKGASFRFKVKGYSMTPFIKDDDIVTISSAANSLIAIGTPVAFTKDIEKRLAIHRIVKKEKALYLIKGDNCSEADGLISPADILGYVSKIERAGKDIGFGLNMEKAVIAYLSRRNALRFVFWIWKFIPFRVRQGLKKYL